MRVRRIDRLTEEGVYLMAEAKANSDFLEFYVDERGNDIPGFFSSNISEIVFTSAYIGWVGAMSFKKQRGIE